ncbi:effector-associated domain 2-containing protein [Streptomyces phaeochromogenes]|uniref:effector-associated domain 2-containing protein n=1 Tax=Streptomyces phaeochromogenes TaxID=1923 RepID=UPI0036B38D8F
MTFPPPRSPFEPPPISNVPGLNLPFEGRDEQIASLLELFGLYGHVLLHDVPLRDPGVPAQGFGKTQVAIAYCHRYTRRYDVAWWFSCRGETDDERLCGMLDEQYRELRKRCAQTYGSDCDPRPDHRWLFIYDDVSNPDRVYEHFVPGTGHRLVTSRSRGDTWGKNRLELGGISTPQASALLLDQTDNLTFREARGLAERINGHPGQLLAIAEMARQFGYRACDQALTPVRSADPDTPPGGMVVLPRARDHRSSGNPLSPEDRLTLIEALVRSPVGRTRDEYDIWLQSVRLMIKPTELNPASDGGSVRNRIISIVNFALSRNTPKVMRALADALEELGGEEDGTADVRRLVDKAVDAWSGDQGP